MNFSRQNFCFFFQHIQMKQTIQKYFKYRSVNVLCCPFHFVFFYKLDEIYTIFSRFYKINKKHFAELAIMDQKNTPKLVETGY